MRSSRAPGAIALVALATLLSTAAAGGGLLLTREEALAAVYDGAEIEAERVFLTADEMREAQELAGGELTSGLIARYLARRDGAEVGRAYVDTHVVRTKRESLLISLGSDGRVLRVDVTAFLEPPEYQAPEPWLGQYRERVLDDELALRRAIRPIAGATLTAGATNAAVRRVLAVDRVLQRTRAVP